MHSHSTGSKILLEVVSNVAPPEIERMVTESLEHVVLAKESSQPQSSAATLIEFELKKILIDKMDKMYSLKRSRKDKDKDEDPSAGSDRGLKKKKTSKDAEPSTCPKGKESKSGSSKGIKSQSKSSGKCVQSKEPEFEVADSDMPQDQEENLGKEDEEPKEKATFDELMSTPIDFPAFIMNGLKINNLTQETLLGLAFRLLKGTRSNYAELEYDFEECYKALLEKLDWENPEGGDYPFDLTKPLPLVMSRNRQKVSPVDYLFINDSSIYQGGFEDMGSKYNGLPGKLHIDKTCIMGNITLERTTMFTRSLVIQKRVEDLQLEVESYQKKMNVTKPQTTISVIRKRDPYTPYQDPQGFIYVDTLGRNRLMRSDELYKFSDRTLTGLQTLLDDITKNIQMEYLPKRRWRRKELIS
ncbi:hypothetical protein Tco_1351996 [Tanacetum coccineum]